MSSPITALVLLLPQTSTAAPLPHENLGGVDVPLVRLTSIPPWNSTGVSFLDYDGDGWIDLYVNQNAGLWHNEGGTTFVRAADLDVFLPPILDRYGASAGDYDNDGLPDIACSPRNDCFYLLRNLDGAGNFLEVASDPAILDDRLSCTMYGESYAWCDVDDDGDLDLWLTIYPDDTTPGSGGNQFLENLGPTGPGGAYHFSQQTAAAGLGIPSNVNRPEGAQFADVDRDGDPDGYANGTLYQNVSTRGVPRFRPLVRTPTGILFNTLLDEGTVFFDYDLDGDVDLLVLHRARLVLWENEGDGTFFNASERLERPGDGATEGCSVEDWDLDGDLDLTTAGFFRRNLLSETGVPDLVLASHAIPDTYRNFCLPAWGDWDKDGDPDCALANFSSRGAFFENTTYDANTDPLARLSIHVRPVRDSATVDRGLETAFGATIEVRVAGDRPGIVRRRFVASSSGYLQQSEYAQTLALPAGPDPLAPARGVRFDLSVDFPSVPSEGLLRIDKHVNPILGGLELATLDSREITVFESGRVRIGASEYAPRTSFATRLASSGALELPSPAGTLAEPADVAAGGFVGMEFDTFTAASAVRVAELVLDGQLALPDDSRCAANVRLYDVTPGEPPRLLRGEHQTTSPRNDRTVLTVDWLLKPQRVFRLLCRVGARRASMLVTNPGGALANRGGLSGTATGPCDDAAGITAPVEAGVAYLELRYRAASSVAPRHR